MSTSNRLVIIGTGGHAKSVFSLISDIGYEVKFFLDETAKDKEFLGIRVATQLSEIPNYQDYGYLIAIGDNSLRKAVRDKLVGIIPIESFPAIIHKSAYVGMDASIGFGTLVFPFSNIGAYSQVDEFCILNTGSILEHDSSISAYSALAPGATVGGNSQIGSGTWVGLNASIMQGIKVGDNSIVGAQSYVNEDVGSNVVAFGTPAKVIRTRKSDEKFL
jgi:sugar O-acyltransferase (sialic acid O-acetyltransferase NeuD family)